MILTLENLSGPGKPLRKEAPDAKDVNANEIFQFALSACARNADWPGVVSSNFHTLLK